jgi:hypothetical protein
MTDRRRSWFSLSPPGQHVLRCARCGADIDLGFATADHHPGACPSCGVECAFLAWGPRTVQIVPADAPASLTRLLRWAQEHLDELEYVEVLAGLEEIAAAVRAEARVPSA